MTQHQQNWYFILNGYNMNSVDFIFISQSSRTNTCKINPQLYSKEPHKEMIYLKVIVFIQHTNEYWKFTQHMLKNNDTNLPGSTMN